MSIWGGTGSALARQQQDEGSLWGDLGRGSLSTLGAIGNILDLPGSMLRDILVLENPLDQLLSPTSADNRTSGRDLLRKAGLAGRRNTWGNFAGGLGAEIALDPLTYLTFGASALSKGGQVAKRAGLMNKATSVAAKNAGKQFGKVGAREARLTTTLDDLIAAGGKQAEDAAQVAAKKMGVDLGEVGSQALGGSIGYGMPFRAPKGVFGTGERALKYARGRDALGRGIRFGTIPGTSIQPINAIARMFDPRIKGSSTPVVQEALKGNFGSAIEALSEPRMQAISMANKLKEAGLGGEEFGDVLRLYGEGISPIAVPTEVQGNLSEIWNQITPAQHAVLRDVTQQARSILDPMVDRGQLMGKKTAELADETANYWPRFLAESLGRKTARDSRVVSVFDASALGRLDVLRDLPGGTVAAKNLAKDDKLNRMLKMKGMKAKTVQAYLEKNHSWIPDSYKMFKKATDGSAGGEWISQSEGRIKQLAERLAGFSDETLQTGIYGNHPVRDLEARLIAAKSADESIRTVTEVLTQPGILNSIDKTLARKPDGMELRKLVREMGLSWGESGSGKGFGQHLARALGEDLPTKKQITALGDQLVDPAIAKDLTEFMDKATGDKAINDWIKIVDGVTNFGKAAWTSVWPAFHVRNRISGMAWNYMKGITSLSSEMAARNYMRGDLKVAKTLKELPQVQAEWRRRLAGTVPKHLISNPGDGIKVETVGPASMYDTTRRYQKGGDLVPPNPGQRVARTEDGYIFFEQPDGSWADRPDAAADDVDLVFESFEQLSVPGGHIDHPAHEMTANEYVLSRMSLQESDETFATVQAFLESGGDLSDLSKLEVNYRQTPRNPEEYYRGVHKRRVEKAIKEGQLIPERVLDEYPDLARSVPEMTDRDALRIFNEMAHADGVVSKHNSHAMDIAQQTGQEARLPGTLGDMLTGQVQPGVRTMRLREAARKFAGISDEATWNPREATIRGVGDATESTFGPMAAGEYVGSWVEGLNRVAPYIELLKKGHSRGEAARIVGEAQIQYGGKYFSQFERQVMKRLFPFYSFSSRMMKQVASELSQRPSGRLGQVVRTQRLSEGQGDIAPDYVRETASIPVAGALASLLGSPPEGTDRYITGLGLMHEDPFSFGPTIRQAGLELLSRTNPFLKGGLEYATGQSFFQRGPTGGRPLDEMDPLLGRLAANITGAEDAYKTPQLLENVLSNSPAARLLSTARQITDPRKRIKGTIIPGPASLINVLTGVRLQDISPGAKEAILRDQLTEEMKDAGAGSFERVYFREEDKAKMTPEQREQAERLQALMNELARRAKKRKAAQKSP